MELMVKGAEELELNLDDGQIEKFRVHYRELEPENEPDGHR